MHSQKDVSGRTCKWKFLEDQLRNVFRLSLLCR